MSVRCLDESLGLWVVEDTEGRIVDVSLSEEEANEALGRLQ